MKLLEEILIVNDSFSTTLSELETTKEPHFSSIRKKEKKLNIICPEKSSFKSRVVSIQIL